MRRGSRFTSPAVIRCCTGVRVVINRRWDGLRWTTCISLRIGSALERLLRPKTYHAVVANPPYITPKDSGTEPGVSGPLHRLAT